MSAARSAAPVAGRLLFAAALLAGASFCLAAWFGWDGPAIVAWKGTGVGLLAAWARWSGARRPAVILAFGALGDVLLDSAGLVVGAVAFLVGHLVAIDLYRRYRIGPVWPAPLAGAALYAAAGAMTGDMGVSCYALVLGGMAGAATISSLPRRVAAGAWLFVASDLLIFARLGPLAESDLPRLLVWPLYFAGQALIAHGLVTKFGRDDDDLHHRL